jgi:hypothetical protein
MSDVFRKEVAIEVSNRSPKPGAFSLVISHLGWGSNVASELSGLARDEADPISVPLGRRAFSGLQPSLAQGSVAGSKNHFFFGNAFFPKT